MATKSRKKASLRGTDNSEKPKTAYNKKNYQDKAVSKFVTVLEIFAGMSGGSLLQNGVGSMLEQSGSATPTTGIDAKKIVVNLITVGTGFGAGMMWDNPHVCNITTGVMLSGLKELGKTVVGKDMTDISFSKKAELPTAKVEEKKPLGNYNENTLDELPLNFFLNGSLADIEGGMEDGDDFAEDVEFEDFE